MSIGEIDPQTLQAIKGVYKRVVERHKRRESDRNSMHVSESAEGLALNDAMKAAHAYGLGPEEVEKISDYLFA